MNRRGLGVRCFLLLCGATAMISCRARDPGGTDQPSQTRASALTAADASSVISALKARPASPLGAGVATGFDAVTGGLKPRFAAGDVAAEPAPARVTLPSSATAALHLEDAATSVAVDVSLRGATAVAAQSAEGYVVYASALAGATVVHRAVPGGTEDFVALDAKPVTTQVAYDLALRAGAAGLRLVGGVLEVLDSGGAPRLRVAPPYIVGADGARTDATLAVTGCAVDTDSAPPWGRAVTVPGATSCQVKVTWPASGVAYPAILDPRWTTAGSMITARQDHTMTVLANGKVLVTGGRSTTGTTGLATAELYDQTTQTWSATGSFTGGRFLHRATQLGTTGNPTTSGKVLISGGINGTTSVNTAQLYSPSAGTWVAAGNLNAARHGHAATLLADGKVLVAGGLNGTTTLATAAIYNPASGSGSWAATTGPLPPTGQKNHTAVLLQTPNQQLNNKVLLVGGNSGSATLAAVYLFDPAQSAFSTLQSMPAARELHTMTVLADGKVLVTGGKNGSTTLNTTAIFDPGFGPGSWSTAGTMTSARWGHTATLLPASIVANGQVLVVGGNSGSAALTSAELFSGTSTWTATPTMPAAVQGHTAVLLGNNMVLVAGGLNGSTVQSAARLYDAAFGLGCSSAGQCPSGNCVNGICCDTACNGGCGACNLAGHLGTCTALANGTTCRASAGACDPAETCNGTSLSCPADALSPSSTVCRAATGECDLAENCTGSSAACPGDQLKTNGTACADDGNACTTDKCNGALVACQHAAGNAGTVCRGAAGECDLDDTCTGSSTACPADAKKASGTACTNDGNVCTTDTCNGSSAACQHPAANAGTQCRAAASDCDLPAACTGSSSTCPANPFKPSSTVCRGSAGACDVAENCTGSSATCPTNTFLPSSTVCRAAAGVCDVAETCTGSSAACPANTFVLSSTICRAVAGECDVAENCTGSSATCPTDAFLSSSTVCRGAAGVCDVAETCTGSSAACPANTFASSSTVCRAAAGQCDVTETCSGGSVTCPADGLASNGTSCSDGDSCTSGETCQAGNCTGGTSSCAATFQLTQTVESDNSHPSVTSTLASNPTAITPGDNVAVSMTVTYTGVSFTVFGNLDTKNVTGGTVAIGSYEGLLEYFSPSQNGWVVLSRAVYSSTGQVLPGTVPASAGFFATLREAPEPGAHIPNGTLNFASLDAGATAKWTYSVATVLSSANLALLANSSQASAMRAVVRIVPAGGSQGDESSVDITPSLSGIQAPVLANSTATASLGPSFGSNTFFAPMTVNLMTASPTTLVIDSTTVFTGEFFVPFASVFTFPFSLEVFKTLPPILYDVVTRDYLRTLETFAVKQNLLSAQVQSSSGPVTNRATLMGTRIPSVHSALHAPADIISGTAVEYTVDLLNQGTGAAGPITFTHVADSGPVPGSSATVPAELTPSEAGLATVDFEVPFRTASGPFGDFVLMNWSDTNGNVYGPLIMSPGSTLHAFPKGSLVVDQMVPQLAGDTVTVGVTARNSLDAPVAGVPVHIVVTGVNAQTFDVVTGPDGIARVSYSGTTIGNDFVVASGTVVTDLIESSPQKIVWATAVGVPCAGRATPLDIMLVVDISPSMVHEPPDLLTSSGKLEAAQAAAHRFIDNLTAPRDQVGVVTFAGAVDTFAQLSLDAVSAKTQLDAGVRDAIDCLGFFCPGGSDVAAALDAALDELDSPRHRPEATKAIIYIGDGGADVDPGEAIARLRASGARVVGIGIGANTLDGAVIRQIASSTNDYFVSPSAVGIDFAFNNLNQDLCRNQPPLVSAGGDQGAYNVRIPASLTLQGEVHDDGPDGDVRLTSEWSVVSGPGPVSFANAKSPVTEALFGLPGTYVLQLEASDGYLTVADRATITVDPDPSIVGASLAVSLSAPGPLETGQSETLTATLTDNLGTPIRDYVLRVTVAGTNPGTTTLVTNSVGVAAFTYRGSRAGTDVLHATALGSTFQLESTFLSVQWIQPASGGAFLTQGWIGSPLDQAKVMERVPVVLSPEVTLASGTVKYYPAAAPADVHVLAANTSGGPGTSLATLDTTVLSNGAYVIELDGTDGAGNQKTSVVLVTVTGEYKPGRVVVEMTDFILPLAGLPIKIGRRYDSLEKDKIGDFGYGWALVIAHPRLEVNPNFAVSLTLPDGRRATFDLILDPFREDVTGQPSFFGVFAPMYKAEPGVFGTLTQEGGCPVVRYNPANPANPIPCFFTGGFIPAYAPEVYTYTDPYGTAYQMAASGELKSIKDPQGNTLSFEPNGIISSTGKSVTFERDGQGRITHVDYPAYFGNDIHASEYTYDGITGDLTNVELARVPIRIMHHTYDQHRLLTSTDPNGNAVRTSTYDANGRLATDTDAMGYVTSYAYDLATRTTTTTYHDTGIATATFDSRGLVLSATDPLGHTTTHEYDANRNETVRTNALGERTTATYDTSGVNRKSITDSVGRRTSFSYDDANMLTSFVDPLDHTATIEYDDRHIPKRFSDELGTLFTFVSSEQGLPVTIGDAAGNRSYLTYDSAGNLTSRTDWIGRVTRATYDEAGHKTTETSARGAVTLYTYHVAGWLSDTLFVNGYRTQSGYDPNGNRTFEYDFEGIRSTNYSYNPLNQLSQVTHHDGTTVRYTRDFRGNPVTMIDENGPTHTTSYEYDLAGNLTKTTFADGTFTTRTYDALNRMISITDERGNTTSLEYDPGCECSDRVTRVTDPLGHANVATYDAVGRRDSLTDANGHRFDFSYDVRGHLTETVYPDGTSKHEAYDARGRRISMTDQTGALTSYGYDDQGQLTSVTDPLSNITSYAYDLDGNLSSVTDANGKVTANEYDLLRRRKTHKLPLDQIETFDYDIAGRQTIHVDFRGLTTTMTYDSLDRLLTKVPDQSLGEPPESYTYSGTGMRITATKGTETTILTYDNRDRLLTKTMPFAGALTYSYDAAGNVATIRSSNPNGTSVDYSWDAANQLAAVTDNRVGGSTTTVYTPTRHPSSLTQPNGVGVAYSYDAVDRITSMLWRHGTSLPFGSWAYSYNDRGQRLTATDGTGRSAAYSYDADSRLVTEAVSGDPRGASFNGALSYAMDGTGNRLSRLSSLAAITSATCGYNANSELDSDGYDANGNTTSGDGHTFAYDFANRLVSKDGTAVTLAYDCDGNRVAKTVAGVTTRFLIDDLNPTGVPQVLEEVVGGAVQTRYTFGTALLSQTHNASATPATSYYGYDAHGNITFLTDAQGAMTDSYNYDSWGNIIARTGTTSNTRGYGGEELDPDLALVNLRARQYDPSRGRFLSRDPLSGSLSRPLTQNSFLFGDADPVNRRDPLGLNALKEDMTLTAGVVGTQVATPATVVNVVWIRPAIYGIVRTYGWYVAGGVTALGLAIYCRFSIEASSMPMQANAAGPCTAGYKNCSTEYPGMQLCRDLPPHYMYTSPEAAVFALSQLVGEPLGLENELTTDEPPCKGIGKHYDAMSSDGVDKVAAIVCCPCCLDTAEGPAPYPEYCGFVNIRPGFQGIGY